MPLQGSKAVRLYSTPAPSTHIAWFPECVWHEHVNVVFLTTVPQSLIVLGMLPHDMDLFF